ncbi:hypothetical protein G5I_04001 [Acromyrmex echinatior]|uniref:Uncharacterized protein n=2 Tax=Acromyrmex echinatior TaxID=103372 RepID=F4WEJ5_ACREC|nr:hypothetical protein G5I_04001 [Acromyrmex echinatior]
MDVLESWEMINSSLPSDLKAGEELVFMKVMERQLLKRMDQVSKKIDEYQELVEDKSDTILSQLLLQLPMQRRLDDSLKELDHYLGQVQELYTLFEMYADNPDKYEKYTMLQFAKTCVSPRLGELPDVLKSIHRLMVPSDQQVYNRSILVLLANQMQVDTQIMTHSKQVKNVFYFIMCCYITCSIPRMRYFTCLLGVSLAIAAFAAIKNDASSIDTIRQALLFLEKDLREDLANQQKWMNVEEREKYLHLIKTYKRFGNQIDEQFSPDRKDYLNSLDSLWLWARAQNEMKGVNGLYGVFRQMQREIVDLNASINAKQLANFAETILRDANAAIPLALDRIANLIVNEKLFIVSFKEASNQMCNEMQSPQQLLYNLYNAVALTEIKGYTMIQFSYMLLRLYNEGNNFSEEIQTLKHQYAIRTSETLRAVKTAMTYAPKSLWRCDPRVHKLGETYTELKQLFQGYIVNEVDLNTEGTCKENCAYYGYTKVYGCYQNQFCSKQRQCNGKILHCEYIDSDMWICPADRNSTRRYEYIEYENGLHYGNSKTCPAGTTKVDSWWRWLFWHCSYCFCYCDDQNSSSDRYFSLRSVMSDISNNKIITGIRLRKINQIIHIQIQEGQLLPRGGIDVSTIEWQPVDAFSIMDSHIRNGVDYHTIVWEKRALDLDDLLAVPDHLLTGVRLRMVGSRLNLEIMITPFNFTSGSLIQPEEKSFWHSNDVTDRTELKYTDPDIPIHTFVPNEPDTEENQYLNFAPSDRRKDAAQSTIPFLDIQPIIPNPPMPLAGAGIFHKGRKGSGGFVALKLTTYDFAPHLQADLPPAPPVLETPNEIKAT